MPFALPRNPQGFGFSNPVERFYYANNQNKIHIRNKHQAPEDKGPE